MPDSRSLTRELRVRQLQIILNAPVGPLNEVRRQRITEALGVGFMPQGTPVQNAVAFVNPMTRETVFVTEGQLNYTIDGDPIQYASDRVIHLLGTVRDVLLLEDRFPVMIQAIAHLDAQGSAIERTIEYLSPLPPVEMRAHFEGLRGVGLRITFEGPPYTCDFRIEPLFSDPAYFYLQLNAGTQAPQSLGRIIEDVEGWLAELHGELAGFVEEVLH